MSQQIEKLPQTGAGKIDLDAWNRLVTSLPRRGRRSVGVRLASANRTLSSLRVSERSERRMLQVARDKVTARQPESAQGEKLPRAAAELRLEVETHESNLKAIEQQIALVRLAIEHLHRRSAGWAAKGAKQASEPANRSDDERSNEAIQRGYAAVRAIRALRQAKHSASANV